MTSTHRQRWISVIERWGFVAGVTGVAANVLLIAFYVFELGGVGDYRWGEYDWTGPANDVLGGIVSTGATIPVALALAGLVGGRPLVRGATLLAVAAMAAMVVTTTLMLADVMAFERQVVVAAAAIVLLLGWTAVIGRAAASTRSLPPRLAQSAVVIGVAGCLGLVLAGPTLLRPWESVVQYVVGGAGLLVGVPAFLAFPIWLILLSNRLRAHLAENDELLRLPIHDPVVVQAVGPVIDRSPL
jgi:hypothetical protein